MIFVSIIIVSANNYDDLRKCVASIYQYVKGITFEIIVVGYKFNSDDEFMLLSEFSELKYIRSLGNYVGYAENNNIGIRQAQGKYVFILNDDTLFFDDSINRLFNYVQAKPVSIISPILLNTDKSVQFKGRGEWNLLAFVADQMKLSFILKSVWLSDDAQTWETKNISGACFLIDRTLMASLGNFDEKYFLCPEDIALSKKARLNGHKVLVYKNAQIIHKMSATVKKIHVAKVPCSMKGTYMYFDEFYGKSAGLFIRILAVLVSSCKILFWTFKKKSSYKETMIRSHYNSILITFSNESCKSVFARFAKMR